MVIVNYVLAKFLDWEESCIYLSLSIFLVTHLSLVTYESECNKDALYLIKIAQLGKFLEDDTA